jgi:hypothetical protein
MMIKTLLYCCGVNGVLGGLVAGEDRPDNVLSIRISDPNKLTD